MAFSIVRAALAAATLTMVAPAAQAGPVLDKVKEDGKIICLVNPNSPGFSGAPRLVAKRKNSANEARPTKSRKAHIRKRSSTTVLRATLS